MATSSEEIEVTIHNVHELIDGQEVWYYSNIDGKRKPGLVVKDPVAWLQANNKEASSHHRDPYKVWAHWKSLYGEEFITDRIGHMPIPYHTKLWTGSLIQEYKQDQEADDDGDLL